MNDNDFEKLIVKNDEGEEKEYDIVVTFDIKEKNKSYVLFTDYSKTDDGCLKIHSAIYDKTGEDKSLKEVTEPDEVQFIEEYIKGLEEELKSGIKLAN